MKIKYETIHKMVSGYLLYYKNYAQNNPEPDASTGVKFDKRGRWHIFDPELNNENEMKAFSHRNI